MTPPDLPPRPVPRAPLTDVVPRRTLVIIAVVLVLAVIGTVLALTLGDGDGDGSDGASGGGAKATASASGSADTKEDEGGGTRTDGSESPSATTGSGQQGASNASNEEASAPDDSGAGTGGSSGSAGDDAVSTTHQGSQGYSIGLPEGWKYRSTDTAGDRFTGPAGQKLLVAWTSTPKGDPVADWQNQERSMTRSQYERIRIEKVGYRGWNTADWEFTYTDGGTRYRTIDRGFVVSGDQGYALMYTAKSANWDTALRKGTWQTLTNTFQPKA